MKILFRAISVAALSTALVTPRLLAQDAAPVPAPAVTAPAEITNAPAANTPVAKPKAPKKKVMVLAAAKPEKISEVKSEPVLSPEPAVTKQNNVNVRGQASINSEVIAHLKKGEPVTVLEEIALKKAKQDEPSRWYRIALPASVSVWAHSSYVDVSNGTVKPRRLNLRGGPGENYSILGRLERGATVKILDTKGEWLKLEPPTNSFGFVAAHLLERQPAPAIAAAPTKAPEPAPIVPPPAPEVPAPTVATVSPAPAPVVPAEPIVPAPAPVPTPTPTPAPAETAATPAPAPVTPAPEVMPELTDTNTPIETVRKIVNREGILKGSVSIQAPSYYELRSLDTGRAINYVFSPTTNLMLKQLKGRRVLITGEEVLDERWQNTPVLVIETLQTVP